MAFLHVPKVSIRGISTCVPKQVYENREYPGFSEEEAEKFISATGVERKRKVTSTTCTSDLCFHGAERLISDLKWSKDEIDALIFVSQTPDYHLPATSCLLQNRLGLSQELLTLDISLGCSGWVHGLQVLASLLCSGQLRKGLLLVGDTTSRHCSFEDKSTFPLFGDAGTATAVEFDEGSDGFKFHNATDGSGSKAIIIPDGGYRNEPTPESFELVEIEPGIRRNRMNTALDGVDVFSFGISKAPETVRCLCEKYAIQLEDVDFFVFHQANLYMNEKIRKKLRLAPEKVPYSLSEFGNTSSATIPLTMCTQLHEQLGSGHHTIIACGFGVGLSWATVYFESGAIHSSELVEV